MKLNTKKNILILALIFALILAFCGALVLSVYCAEKVAFADNDGTFIQLVKDGYLPFSESDHIWSTNIDQSSITFENSFSVIPLVNSDGYISQNITVVQGHKYILVCAFFYNVATRFDFTFPGSDTSFINVATPSLSQLVGGLHNRSYVHSFTANNSSSILRISLSNTTDYTLRISNVMLIDLTATNDSDILSVTNWQTAQVYRYFGMRYFPYTTGVRFANLSTYGTYDDGYNIGYAQGVNEGLLRTYTPFNFDGVSSYYQPISSLGSSFVYPNQSTLRFTTGYNYFGDFFFVSNSVISLTCRLDIPYITTNASISYFVDTPLVCLYPRVDYEYQSFVFDFYTYGDNPQLLCSLEMFVDECVLTLPAVDTSSLGNYPSYLNFSPSLYPNLNVYPTFTLSRSNAEYSEGYNAGVFYADNRVLENSASFTAGYNRGLSAAENVTLPSVISAAIDIPVNTFRSLLNFDLFGTNLNTFVLSLLSFGIVVAIIKLILGR